MKFKTKPMQHQLEFLQRKVGANHIGLAWDMGTGKTKVAIDWLRYKYMRAGRVLNTLIICPVIALLNWRDEFDKHSNCVGYVNVLSHSSTKYRSKNLEKGFSKGQNIVITNYKGLRGMYQHLSKYKWDCLILDESHYLKNPDAKMTDYAIRLSDNVLHRACLSGTPMPNGPIDIFTQTYILDRGRSLGTSFTSYRAKYFFNMLAKTEAKYERFVPYKSVEDELRTLIGMTWDRITKDECIDLPDKMYRTIKLEMIPEQRKMYTELVKDAISVLPDGAVLADTAGKELIRLRQVSSGFYTNDVAKKIERFKTNQKIEACKELVASSNEKWIIWAVFRDNIFQLLEAMKPYNPASIFGDTKNKYAEQKRFNEDADCRVIVCNPQSASTAINLVSANNAIYFSQDHNFVYRSQSEARCYRNGSQIHNKVTFYDLVYEKSVDLPILEALQSKEEMSEKLLGSDVKELLRKML